MSGYGLFIALLLLIAAIVAGLTLLLRRRAILQASRAQNAQLKMLSEAVHAIASASHLDADAVCRLVYDNVMKVVKADMFQIGLFDGDHYDIRVRIEGGHELPPARYTMDRGGIVKWLRDNGKAVLVRDFEKERDLLPAKPTHPRENPPRSAVFLPMLGGDLVVGAMLLQSVQPNAYDESQQQVLGIIANQAAGAMQQAQALARERRRVEQLELVSEVARQTQASLTLPQLQHQLSRAIAKTFNLYSVLICLLDESGENIVCNGSSQDRSVRIRTRVGVGLVGAAVQERRILVVDDVTQDRLYLPVTLLPDTRSEAALPLMIEDRVVGVLDLQSKDLAAFARDDQRYLEVLAQQVAVAVEETRLYESELGNQRLGQELSTARDIQKSFLPRFAPQVPGWGLAASWQSATQVGGDFYDFIPLRRKPVLPDDDVLVPVSVVNPQHLLARMLPVNDVPVELDLPVVNEASQVADPTAVYKYGIVIADVAGKGVPAAIFMGLARTLMRAVGFTGRPPVEALQRVNALIFADTRTDLFVTMCYAHWFPDTAQVELSNAGHNPPLLLLANGSVELLSMPSLPLGVEEEIKPRSICVSLELGEAIVFYTDGITDALNTAGEEFGMGQLRAVCANTLNLSANQILDGIRTALAAHTQGEPRTDDETIVVLKRELT